MQAARPSIQHFLNDNNKEATMSTQFDHVSVVKKSNIYFDGKCISHNIIFPDGTKKNHRGDLSVEADVRHRRAGNNGDRVRQMPRAASQRRRVGHLRSRATLPNTGQLQFRH